MVDFSSLGAELLKTLEQSFENITVNYISKYFKANQLEQLSLSKNQYYVIDPTYSIENYFSEADAVIAGGGLIKYESAFCCIPSAVLSFDLEQQIETQNFAKESLGYDLGLYSQITHQELEKKLIYYLKESSLRKKIYQSTKERFYTDSGDRLAEHILNI
jgi:spore coat polysaccharide biosynthesis predicted glycosyltransferase SpsG